MKIIPTQQLIDIIITAQDKASSVANDVDNNIKKLGNTSNLLGRIPGFNTLSNKLSGIGTTIKGKLSPYLDSARGKLERLSGGAKGFGAVLGPLKGALSMTVGMIGYDLVNGLVGAARASINAASQLDYFGKRLKMSASETTQFRGEIDSLQKEFRKVDMTAVGATAEEMAVKFNLPKQSLGDLTRMTAVLSSTFVKEGRTQEDAILAVSDALDGQFKRLQEIGITQDTLKANGWNGNLEDQDSLIKALNKSMQEMGYEQTAKDITNLDEAWGALTIAGGQLLQKVLVPITPILIQAVDGFLKVADAVGGMINTLGGMPDWAKLGIGVAAFGLALVGVSTAISLGMIPALTELVAGLAASALAAWDLAAAMLGNPLTWVALALAAIVVVVYEVGKAFGWWTDVNSMLDAIWAGLNRLWSAFINHPDVQSFLSLMAQAWNWVSNAVGKVVNWVGSFFRASAPGQFDIVRAVINALSLAWNAMTLPIRTVIKVIQTFLKIQEIGRQAAKGFISNVINNIRTLPGKVKTYISNTAKSITTGAANWASNARTKAKETVTAVTKSISGLPGKVYTEFANIGGKIKSAVGSAVKAATSFGSDLKNAVLKALHIASPGIIQRKIDTEFQDTVSRIQDAIRPARKAGSEFGSAIVDGFGNAGLDDTDFSVYSGQTQKLEVHYTHDYNFQGLPDTVSAEEVASMINDAATNDEFTKRLTRNPSFQLYDGREKAKLSRRSARSRGVI